MTKRYDLIVVGAGPAGFLSAKAAAENGLEVALLERKPDPTQLTRACGQTIISMNEYYFGDLVGYNTRDKRFSFPVNGFSFEYDGPYRNLYSWHIYTPNGYKVEFGDCQEQRKKGDHGRVGIAFDKETLFQCLLKEVQACSVDVFPGTNVENITTTNEGVRVEGNGSSFKSSYLIAADGVNSHIAQIIGFNKERDYYCNLYVLSWYMSGVEPPDPDVMITTYGFPNGVGALFFLVPRANEGDYNTLVLTVDPRLDLKAADDYFINEAFCTPWFKKAKRLRAFSAICNCYSPIVEPYKDRVLVVGDVGATQDLEITGAMMSGWKAGQAISTAVQEANLGLEIRGISMYINWWQETYVNHYSYDTYMKSYALPYILTTEEEINYVFGLIKEPLRPCLNPYTSPVAEALKKVLPIVQQDRPDLLQKLVRTKLPASQVFDEVTRISKPVS